MTKPEIPTDPALNHFARRVSELRKELSQADPFSLAIRTASLYEAAEAGHGEFHLALWQREIALSYPDFTGRERQSGQELPLADQALLLYYFTMADGTPLAGRWVSFTELADGKFYNQAYQGYTGGELARAFRDDRQAFEQAATSLGGKRQDMGDSAFSFFALPRVPLLAVFWQGDEDFPSSYQILFDASANHNLPTDVCAILGGRLARRIISAKSSQT